MAEIRIILYKDITIQTKKLGELKFSTLSHANILKAGKSVEKSSPSKEAFLQVLYALQLDPKEDRNSLASLSDATLKRIGKELLHKSKLIDRYEKAKKDKGNFFSKFVMIIKTLIEEKKKTYEQFIKQMYPNLKFLQSEKSQLEMIAGIVDSSFRKIIEEEEKKQAMMRDMLDSPWKRELDQLGKSVQEHIAGLEAMSSNHLLNDLKAAHEIPGADFIKGQEKRLIEEAEQAKKMFGPSFSTIESLNERMGMNQRLIDDIQAQMDASRKFANEHQDLFNAAEKFDTYSRMVPIELNFKDKLLEMMPFLTKMPDWQAEAAVKNGIISELSAIDEAARKSAGDFAHLMKIGETVAADLKKLYSGMSLYQINRYQKMWQPANFPAFFENPLNAFGDYIVSGEESGFFEEGEIEEAKSIQSFLRQKLEGLPTLSKQAKVLCAVIGLEFVKALKEIGERLENNTLTLWAVGVVTLILSTQVLILYYQLLNEKSDDSK